MFHIMPDQFSANSAQFLGRGDGQHNEVRRIDVGRYEPVTGGFDRCVDGLGRSMAGGREIGPDDHIDAANLGGGSH